MTIASRLGAAAPSLTAWPPRQRPQTPTPALSTGAPADVAAVSSSPTPPAAPGRSPTPDARSATPPATTDPDPPPAPRARPSMTSVPIGAAPEVPRHGSMLDLIAFTPGTTCSATPASWVLPRRHLPARPMDPDPGLRAGPDCASRRRPASRGRAPHHPRDRPAVGVAHRPSVAGSARADGYGRSTGLILARSSPGDDDDRDST